MVINFWYSTCGPCKTELPVVRRGARRARRPGPLRRRQPVRRCPTSTSSFAAERGVHYELYRDPDGVYGRAVGIATAPVTLFVDGRRHHRPPDRCARRGRAARVHERAARREPVVLASSRHDRRGEPVRLHPAADVPAVLPRPVQRRSPAIDARRSAVPCSVSGAVSGGFLIVFVVVGAIGRFVHQLAGSTRTRSTQPPSSAWRSSCSASPMLFGYRLPIMHAEARRRRARPHRVVDVRLRHRLRGRVDRLHDRDCSASTLFGTAEHRGLRRRRRQRRRLRRRAWRWSSSALTVSLAVANVGLLSVLRSGMQYVEMVAGAFVLLSGLVPAVVLLEGRRPGDGRPDQRRGAGLPERDPVVPERPLASGRGRVRIVIVGGRGRHGAVDKRRGSPTAAPASE